MNEVELFFAPERLWSALPIAARVVGFASLAPGIGAAVPSIRYRMGLAAVLGLVLIPAALARATPAVSTGAETAAWFLANLGWGLFLGLALKMALVATEWAALLAERQLGLLPGTTLEDQTALWGLSQLYQIATMALLLTLGCHRVLVAALLDDSLRTTGNQPADLIMDAAALLTRACWMALQIAAPVLVVLLGARLASGMLGRLLPQLSAPGFWIPAQIVLGLVLIFLSIALLAPSVEGYRDFLWQRVVADLN